MDVILTDEQRSRLESIIGQFIDDCPEIEWIHPARFNKPGYEVGIIYDGTNNKANRGRVYFTCYFRNDMIEDFELLDITGTNYNNIAFNDYNLNEWTLNNG